MKFRAGGESFELSASGDEFILTKGGKKVDQGIPVYADPGAGSIEHLNGVAEDPAVGKAVYLLHHGECTHITPAIEAIEN
ncbi:MAG: hypothetical protein A2927_01030 [Candidatus Komeilibacteria bacterium RIFCSPLOWO2_01_FULL_45_10]|uniref:Uncharacterized protein n=1 Tax=Candidatus Komeilibacteria bacterium RIFCSPLOWO2_01_FULL_45_10 TaxID=1798550 RepID=A0A1G2BL46_9BACT|nr:MAG: hypothetical protein A2927_01030 [Candidatus Komeilibacteria bacterium RIFCSPLOWO2_01_FULL_45_10]